VQIAKARGAYVIGTASAAKHEFVRSLGADELIDHQTCDFAAMVGDLDVALDSLGGEIARRSIGGLVCHSGEQESAVKVGRART
jgi:NADPH:quinone reductase-like Zn-dependent oxidoreductase